MLCTVILRIEIEREADGRWIAEVLDLPGVVAYGSTRDAARAAVKALALQVVADRLEHGDLSAEVEGIHFADA